MISFDRISDRRTELDALFQCHHKELEIDKSTHKELNFDWDALLAQEDNILFISINDDKSNLIGYCINYLINNPFYKNELTCLTYLFYIKMKNRRGGLALKVMKLLELKLEKVGVIDWNIGHLCHYDLSSLYKRAGFHKTEIMYKKCLR